MSLASAITKSKVWVELLAKDKVSRVLDRLGNKIKAFAARIASIGIGLTAFSIAAAQPFISLINTAARAEAVLSKFGFVFGKLSDDMLRWSNDFATTVGRSKLETQDALATYQAFFSGLGLGAERSSDLSKQLHTLSVDFASFHNMTDREAMTRFISGLSGSGEVLDRFGINIKAAALDMKLLDLGFKTIEQGATEQQKVLARYMLIMDSMGRQGAIGNALETQDEFFNQIKRLRAIVFDTAVELGNVLLPEVSKFASWLLKGKDALKSFITDNKDWILFLAKAVLAVGALGVSLTLISVPIFAVGFSITTLTSILGLLASTLSFILSPIGMVVTAIVGLILAFSDFNNLGRKTSTMLDALKESYQDLVDGVATGNLGGAFNLTMLRMKVAFQETVQSSRDWWDTFITHLMNGLREWSLFFTTVFNGLKTGLHVILFSLTQLAGSLKDLLNWDFEAFDRRDAEFLKNVNLIMKKGGEKQVEIYKEHKNAIKQANIELTKGIKLRAKQLEVDKKNLSSLEEKVRMSFMLSKFAGDVADEAERADKFDINKLLEGIGGIGQIRNITRAPTIRALEQGTMAAEQAIADNRQQQMLEVLKEQLEVQKQINQKAAIPNPFKPMVIGVP